MVITQTTLLIAWEILVGNIDSKCIEMSMKIAEYIDVQCSVVDNLLKDSKVMGSKPYIWQLISIWHKLTGQI